MAKVSIVCFSHTGTTEMMARCAEGVRMAGREADVKESTEIEIETTAPMLSSW